MNSDDVILQLIFRHNWKPAKIKALRSPAVPPPLLVPLSLPLSLPRPLALSLAPRDAALALTLTLALTPAAHHRLRPPQEVVHTHVVVVRTGGEGAVLRHALLVSEARGRSLVRRQGGVVGGLLVHAGIGRQSLPGSRGPDVVVVVPHVVIGPVQEHVPSDAGEPPVHRLAAQIRDEPWSLVEFRRAVCSRALPAMQVVLFRATPT